MLDKLATSDDAVTAAEAKQKQSDKEQSTKVLDDLGYESKRRCSCKSSDRSTAERKAKAEAEAAAKSSKSRGRCIKSKQHPNVKLERMHLNEKAAVKKVTGKSKAADCQSEKSKKEQTVIRYSTPKKQTSRVLKKNTKKLNVTLKRLSKGSKYYVRV